MESWPRWNPTILYVMGFLLLLLGAATVNSVPFASLVAAAGLVLVVDTTIRVMGRMFLQYRS